jgi:hypothetical protein
MVLRFGFRLRLNDGFWLRTGFAWMIDLIRVLFKHEKKALANRAMLTPSIMNTKTEVPCSTNPVYVPSANVTAPAPKR